MLEQNKQKSRPLHSRIRVNEHDNQVDCKVLYYKALGATKNGREW